MFFFFLMEFLQGLQYFVIAENMDAPECANWINKFLTILGYAHICLQVRSPPPSRRRCATLPLASCSPARPPPASPVFSRTSAMSSTRPWCVRRGSAAWRASTVHARGADHRAVVRLSTLLQTKSEKYLWQYKVIKRLCLIGGFTLFMRFVVAPYLPGNTITGYESTEWCVRARGGTPCVPRGVAAAFLSGAAA